MARPKKLNADYFSHDNDMRNDPKIKAIRRKFKLQGYAVYNMILETLTDSDNFTLKIDNLSIELMAGDFDCEASFLLEVIDYCILLNLFQKTGEIMKCSKLIERFEHLLSKRKRDRTKVTASENYKSKELSLTETHNNGVIDDENTQSIVNKSIVNKKKEENKNNNTSIIIKNTKKKSCLDYENLFNELWDRYPRQEGRKAAFNKFKSSVKTQEDLENINLAMNKYLNKLKNENTEPQFIKMGSTFFNQWQEILKSKQIPIRYESKPALTAMSWLDTQRANKSQEVRQIGQG